PYTTLFRSQGEAVPLFGDGSSARDYTFVDDIVAGIVAALERSRGYEIFNLGRSEVVSLKDLIGHLEAALGKKAKIVFQSEQPGDVRQTHADLTHSRKAPGYEPQIGIQEGIRRFVGWYRAQRTG